MRGKVSSYINFGSWGKNITIKIIKKVATVCEKYSEENL